VITVGLVATILIFDLRDAPTWRAAAATLAIWVLGVVVGWLGKMSFDQWIDSA
jgi:type IV secretory pathway TrbD component